MRALAMFAILIAFGCGGGDEPSTANRGAQTPAGAPGGAPAPVPGAGSGSGLIPMLRAENRIDCPVPSKGSKTCDPNAPRPVQIGGTQGSAATGAGPDLSCPEGEYCLPTSEGFLCGRCDERASVRAQFKDRDFIAEINRDPFQSFFIRRLSTMTTTTGTQTGPIDPGNRCQRTDQLVASNYGFQDLKLVGIVSQGTQRKVLMMDPSNYGRIIRRGDCVGKEKAWVKDIGNNFVCFEVTLDNRPTNQHCVELHTKNLASQLPSESPAQPPSRTPVAPPSTVPPRAGDTGSAVQPPAGGQRTAPPTTIRPVTP